jgi:hypothetical protein
LTDDLDLAHICLEVLKFCSTFDVVALAFYERLSPVYVALSRQAYDLSVPRVLAMQTPTVPPDLSPPHLDEDISSFTSPHSRRYLLKSAPNMDVEQVKLSSKLLHMLCRPYGDRNPTPEKLEHPQMASTAVMINRPSQSVEIPPLPESRFNICNAGWAFDSSQAVHWEETRSAIGAGALKYAIPENSRFLGSEEPCGWAPPELFDEEPIAA